MVNIVNHTGVETLIPDESINVVSGPYPRDPGTRSYIRGNFGPGALETSEEAAHLVARLQVTLAKLTRPNGTPVWIKTSAITMLRYPLDTEIQSPPNLIRSVIVVGSFQQAIQEDIGTVRHIMSQDAPAVLATSRALTRNYPRELTSEFHAPVTVASMRRSKTKTKYSKNTPKRVEKRASYRR
jgi:hypothetical protein